MIHVIIPVHNRIKYTLSCIESLKKQNIFDKLNIIVVDDGSTDGTSSYIKRHYPEITLLKGSGNLFWGGAVNFGISYACKIGKKNDWILLVNNDVEFVSNSISDAVSSSAGRNTFVCDSRIVCPFSLLQLRSKVACESV